MLELFEWEQSQDETRSFAGLESDDLKVFQCSVAFSSVHIFRSLSTSKPMDYL